MLEIIDSQRVNPAQHLGGSKRARIEIGKKPFYFLK
jgi:hypothetical protein